MHFNIPQWEIGFNSAASWLLSVTTAHFIHSVIWRVRDELRRDKEKK